MVGNELVNEIKSRDLPLDCRATYHADFMAPAFALANLPPGSYTIEAWHEKYGVMEQMITIGENETKTLEFTFGG